MTTIELQSVVKNYERTGAPVLEDISVRIERGQFVTITGSSGSGKTTLLNIIGAIDRPTSGQLRVLDVDLARAGDEALAQYRRQVGYVFQSFFLSSYRTALENVLLALAFGTEALSAQRERARQALVAVGLEGWVDRPAALLSGGQRQRVALARALVSNPALVLADEPVGQLDGDTRDHMIDVLRRYQREHEATVLVVTHESELVSHADRTLELVRGRLSEAAARAL